MAKEKNKLNISIALALILILFMASGIILSLKTLFNAREDISDVKKELIFAEVNINNIKNFAITSIILLKILENTMAGAIMTDYKWIVGIILNWI